MTIYICAPTYQETSLVESFLASLRLSSERLVVVIVNSCPQDETTKLINNFRMEPSRHEIVEIFGDESEYWASAVQRALDYVNKIAKVQDFICLMNIDVCITNDVFKRLKDAWDLGKYAFIAAVLHNDGKIISSGTKVRSWFWTLNAHPLMHLNLSEVNASELPEIDYAPARCVFFPVDHYRLAGPIKYKPLPHYGADSEFTLRLTRRTSLPGAILPSAKVEVNTKNTGMSVYGERQNIYRRIRQLFHIKNPSNPIYRSRFIYLSYPKYAIFSSLVFYSLRSVLDCLGISRLVREKWPYLKISH